MIRTSDICFMKRGSQLIKLLLGDYVIFPLTIIMLQFSDYLQLKPIFI
jgi:hypothetical protein